MLIFIGFIALFAFSVYVTVHALFMLAASCAYPAATGPALLMAAIAVCSWSVLFWTSPIKFTWGGS